MRLDAMLRELTLADERFLANSTGASADAIRGYLDEPISSPAFSRHSRKAEQNFRELKIMSADLCAKRVLFPCAAVRALKPQCVVETGIANGDSSAYSLLALHPNQRGTASFHGIAGSRLFARRKIGRMVCAEMAAEAVPSAPGRYRGDFAETAAGACAHRHFSVRQCSQV